MNQANVNRIKQTINVHRPMHLIAGDLIREIEGMTHEAGMPISFQSAHAFEVVTAYLEAIQDNDELRHIKENEAIRSELNELRAFRQLLVDLKALNEGVMIWEAIPDLEQEQES